MADKISVIVPVYNVEAYLRRCVDSILNQTYENFELILVDDGSPDGCPEICNEYAEKDSRVRVIHQENRGISAARNAGLDAATGDYISFVDSDDWVHPQYFEIMMHFQQRKNYDLVICGYARPSAISSFEKIFTTSITEKALTLEDIFRSHKTKSYVWGKLYRRTLICRMRFIEKKIAEDAAFNGMVLGSHEKLSACYLPVPLYYYFDRPGSLVHQMDYKNTLELAEIFKEYAEATDSVRAKRIYLIEVMKRALSARYGFSVSACGKNGVTSCNQVMKSAVTQMRHIDEISTKEKVQYTALYLVPQIYRIGRIWDDPTLLKWEKSQKKTADFQP